MAKRLSRVLENGDVCSVHSYAFKCSGRSMKYVGFYTPDERHDAFKKLCIKKQVNMTDLFNSFMNKFILENA